MTDKKHDIEIDWGEMSDLASSYADGFQRVKDLTGLDDALITDRLLDFNIEKCPNCGWFTDSFHLLDDGEDDPDGFCDNCRKYNKKNND